VINGRVKYITLIMVMNHKPPPIEELFSTCINSIKKLNPM